MSKAQEEKFEPENIAPEKAPVNSAKKRRRVEDKEPVGLVDNRSVCESIRGKALYSKDGQDPQCFLRSKSRVIGVCFALEKSRDTGVLKAKNFFPKYVGDRAWKEVSKHDELQNMTHFLPLFPTLELSKNELKTFIRPFRHLFDAYLQKKFEENAETNSNGVMLLMIVASLFSQLIDISIKSESEDISTKVPSSLDNNYIFKGFSLLMERISALWKPCRQYVTRTLITFCQAKDSRRKIFLNFDSSFSLMLILPFSMGNASLGVFYDTLISCFLNELFIHSVKEYTSFNKDLDIHKSSFKSEEEVPEKARSKLLFQFFAHHLKRVAFLGFLADSFISENVSNDLNLSTFCERLNAMNSWIDFRNLIYSSRLSTRTVGKFLLDEAVFPGSGAKSGTQTFSVFKVHVLISALKGYHQPFETSDADLVILAQSMGVKENYHESPLKFLIPDGKSLFLKSKLNALDESLGVFKEEYKALNDQKSRLISSLKKASLNNANLKQQVMDLTENLRNAEEMIRHERQAAAIERTKALNSSFVEEQDLANGLGERLDASGKVHLNSRRSLPKQSFFNRFFSCFGASSSTVDESNRKINELEENVKEMMMRLKQQQDLMQRETQLRVESEQKAKNLKLKAEQSGNLVEELKSNLRSLKQQKSIPTHQKIELEEEKTDIEMEVTDVTLS